MPTEFILFSAFLSIHVAYTAGVALRHLHPHDVPRLYYGFGILGHLFVRGMAFAIAIVALFTFSWSRTHASWVMSAALFVASGVLFAAVHFLLRRYTHAYAAFFPGIGPLVGLGMVAATQLLIWLH
jgi:hypothetical protein